MPIFEYVCEECRHRFEKIVSGGAEVRCPACESARLEKQLSVFAVGAGRATAARREAPRAPLGPCGSCGDPRGPGSCATD